MEEADDVCELILMEDKHKYSKDHARGIDTVVQVVHILWCFCAGVVWWDETRALKQLRIWNGNNLARGVWMVYKTELQKDESYLVTSSPPHSEHG